MRFRFTGSGVIPLRPALDRRTISIFGTLIGQLAMQFTAIVWLHASAWQISLLAASQLVPGFAVGLAAVVWVDRLPRRPILIAADVLRALALTSVPLAAVAGALTLGQLFAVGAAMSALTVCFNVGRTRRTCRRSCRRTSWLRGTASCKRRHRSPSSARSA